MDAINQALEFVNGYLWSGRIEEEAAAGNGTGAG